MNAVGFTVRDAGARSAFPSRVFAPYFYVGEGAAGPRAEWQACPAPFLTLAFVLAGRDGKPAWNGEDAIESRASLVRAIRRAGKDVIVSFGGQAGRELGQVIPDAATLRAAYASVVDALDLKWVDFDIEGASTADVAAVTRRHKAIAKLQRAKPGLTVSFTLPVMPDGLPPNELRFLRIAKEQGVRVDVVNIMAMDYGPAFSGDMGRYAVDAAKSLRRQLQGLGLADARVGVCPMIGVNDVRTEIFTLADARALVDFAQRTAWVRWLSFWSVNRDNGRGGDNLDASSGVSQKDWQFSDEFARFK